MSTHDISRDQNINDLLSEIQNIKQFYDVEVENDPKAWDIIVAVSEIQVCKTLREALQNRFGNAHVHITSPATLANDAKLILNEQTEAVSPISAGLAMKYFKTGLTGPEINLVPSGADEIHNIGKFGLMTAAVAMVALILSLAVIPPLESKFNHINKAIEEYKQNQNIENIITEITRFNENIKALAGKVQALKAITDSPDSARNWTKILADIARRTPENLRITNLTTKNNTTLNIVGQASSYENISRFITMLNNSPYLSSATLVKSEIEPSSQNLRQYNIICTFSAGGSANAD
jgi:Tfp pilus assembly protein PilN